MCNPMLILAGLSIATTAVGAVQQQKAANAQTDALNQQAKAQAEELAAKRDADIGERMRAARQAAARRLVAAGEAGVGGQSTELSVLHEFGAANQDAAKVAKQAAFEDRANQAQFRSAQSQISRPNALMTGLQIANAGAAGWAAGSSMSTAWKDAGGWSGIKSSLKIGK